ncbi:hypothetical protein GGR51DRAFT_281890 [Nemania sp. FL0031]|nr:hypothetical protein GGR51DRAFT_281890 [Nemania sp. FL0031]
MSPSQRIQEQLCDISKLSIFKCQRRKRSNSLPAMSTNWVAREKFVPSTQLTYKARGFEGRSWLSREIRLEPVFQGPGSYESEEEDRRNEVPTTYSPNHYILFQAPMKGELEAEFQRLKRYGAELSDTLGPWKEKYRQLCESISQTSGLSWAAPQWDEFFAFADDYYNLREELFAIEAEMGHIHAQLRLFLDATPPHDFWLEEEATSVWAPEEVNEQQAKSGRYPVLEWNGVDYSAMD